MTVSKSALRRFCVSIGIVAVIGIFMSIPGTAFAQILPGRTPSANPASKVAHRLAQRDVDPLPSLGQMEQPQMAPALPPMQQAPALPPQQALPPQGLPPQALPPQSLPPQMMAAPMPIPHSHHSSSCDGCDSCGHGGHAMPVHQGMPCGHCQACMEGKPCVIANHEHCPHGVCIFPGRILACDICNPNLPDGVSEWFRAKYPCVHGFCSLTQLGHAPYRAYGDTRGGVPCAICQNALTMQPCKECEGCKAGEQCLYAVCRNCVLPNRLNSCNTCDFTLNGAPCGTCDSCRDNGLCHEPCGHQRFGIFNPTNEPPLLAATPRFIVSAFNGRGHRFPIYYNPAPYYKTYWNPGNYVAHQRPFTACYLCPSCNNETCTCTDKCKAGQIPYYYACKFCLRNPCSCYQDICQSNRPLDPVGTAKNLQEFYESEEAALNQSELPGEPVNEGNETGDGNLFDDDLPLLDPIRNERIPGGSGGDMFDTPPSPPAGPGRAS